MNINRNKTNIAPVSFAALRVKQLTIQESQQFDLMVQTYDKINKRFSGFNGLFRADFKSKYPGMETCKPPKGFFMRLGENMKEALHFLKFSPSSPLIIKFFENDEQLLSLKKVAQELLIDTSTSFEEKIVSIEGGLESIIEKVLKDADKELLLLADYTEVFNNIKRKITSTSTKEDLRLLIEKALIAKKSDEKPDIGQVSIRLAPEISKLAEDYYKLWKTLYQHNGAFTARFKDAYFLEENSRKGSTSAINHKEKGVTFSYGDGEKINLLSAKSPKTSIQRFRVTIFDSDNNVKSGYVLNTDGVVEGIRHLNRYNNLESFNLRALTDSKIEELELPEIVKYLISEINKYKIFIDEFVEKYHVVKYKKNFQTNEEIAQNRAKRLEQKHEREQLRLKRIEEKRLAQEARILKRQAREAARKEKFEKQKLRREASLAPRIAQAQAQDEPQKQPMLPDLGLMTDKALIISAVKKSNQGKLDMTTANLKAVVLEEAEKKRVAPNSKEVREAVEKVFKKSKAKSMMDINTSDLVTVINGVFATPVKDRNPRYSHEKLANGRIFEGRFFINARDGAKVSVTKIKYPRYVDFSYYAIKVEKGEETKVVNIDPLNGSIILSGTDGKPILVGSTVKYLSKQKFAELYSKEDSIAPYIQELLTTEGKGEVVKSGLKEKKRIVTPEEILNAELPVLDNCLDEFQNIDKLL